MIATQPKADQLSPWQARAMAVPECYDLALTGGRGGGKTRLLAALFLRHCELHGARARCLVVRRSFPGLADLESEFRQFFFEIYGDTQTYNSQKHKFELPNGASITLDQLETEADFQKFQGKSFSHLAVDEAGQWNSPILVDRLRASLRAPEGVPTRFIILANPGGAGHQWVAKRHALQASWTPYIEPVTGAQYVTISSTFRDNVFINRDEYARNLKAACSSDPELAAAWLDGNWAIIRGAYFSSVLDEHLNMFEPWPSLPDSNACPPGHFRIARDPEWRTFLSHDWGMSAPSVTYLCAESPGTEAFGKFYPRGSILLLDEYASAQSDDPTKGLGLTVPECAARIKSMCDKWGVAAEGVADDAIFSKTGAEAGSIADEFRRAGVVFSRARKGSRIAGWQLMRRMLADAGKRDVPGLYISRNCRYFWQTVPSLPRDPRRAEDVDSGAADHGADACRYALNHDEPVFYTGIKWGC